MPSYVFYESAPSGDTTLVFLPGTHFLKLTRLLALAFYGAAANFSSLTLKGYDERQNAVPTAIIDCSGERWQYGLRFNFFQTVSVSNLQLRQCSLAWRVNVIAMDTVILYNSLLRVKTAYKVNISNSHISAPISTSQSQTCDFLRILILDTIIHGTLSNVSFIGDHSPCENSLVQLVHTYNIQKLEIANCTFSWSAVNHIYLHNSNLNLTDVLLENGHPALKVIDSVATLSGSVSFLNNSAHQGGAVTLHEEGYLVIADNSRLLFEENHAEYVGGAIHTTGNDIENYLSIGRRIELCRIAFESGTNTTVRFFNNTAQSGGSVMYGIALSRVMCYNRYIASQTLFEAGRLQEIFTIVDSNEMSAVSSNPQRVCICPDQSTPDCLAILPDQNIPHLHYTVYHGQNFTVPVAAVGFNFALTSGSVYAQILNSEDATLGSEFEYVQGVSHTGCSLLQYSVLSSRAEETLVLSVNGKRVVRLTQGIEQSIEAQYHNNVTTSVQEHVENPNIYFVNDTFSSALIDNVFQMAGYVQLQLQEAPIFITITLLDCPLGFVLSDQEKCVCKERFLEKNLTCNINDQTVHRDGTTWVNASFSGNASNGVIVHMHCPFGYCKQEPVDVDLTNPDTQCAFDHSGILCGACKPNFSLALGGSQCLPNCSNKYVSLVVAIALAGFALVFFIKILNLTVSQGTINGLIFYANIVAANCSIFFPAQRNHLLSFLSVFIAWLNLDLGIETCFIKGLDGYWKTWLQFVFPFYVWAIAGAIILVSHYSTRATKIFGYNSVPVLATLLLLSYAKLLRSIITIFSFTTVEYPNHSSTEVWAFDGNVQYLSPKHVVLFVFALAIVLLLWLPYTAVLLSAQWLRTQTHRKRLHCLKPFLDAYYGPFKNNHYNWVGVLLVVRGVLFIFFASFFAFENNVNLLLVIASSVSLIAIPQRYKSVRMSLLENSFILNLTVLAGGTLYNRLTHGNQEALAVTSVGVAFVQFIGITAFHGWKVLLLAWKEYKSTRSQSELGGMGISPQHLIPRSDSRLSSSSDSDEDKTEVTHSEVCLSDLRREAAQALHCNTTSAGATIAGILVPLDQNSSAGSFDAFEPLVEETDLLHPPQDDSIQAQSEAQHFATA